MTREAKIGMLTGLGVIVVIGVLLSEYLGDRNTGPTAAAGATGRMATPPVLEAYRQRILTPVGVPAMTPAGGGERTQLPGGVEIASPIATGSGGMPPTLFAADAGSPASPSVGVPVSPIATGPTLMDGGAAVDGPPTFRLESATIPVKVTTPVDNTVKIYSTTYVIAQGDTLAKIAKKFYGTSKNSDVARIVAANRVMLKDPSATLVVNKKLVIPLPSATPAAPVAVPMAAAAPKPLDPGMVSVPGGTSDGVVPIPGIVQPPKKDGPVAVLPKPEPPKPVAPKPAATYTVQTGDTLEKIARKLMPSKVTETVAKLTSLNGIKDPSKLKVGQVLKVPA